MGHEPEILKRDQVTVGDVTTEVFIWRVPIGTLERRRHYRSPENEALQGTDGSDDGS